MVKKLTVPILDFKKCGFKSYEEFENFAFDQELRVRKERGIEKYRYYTSYGCYSWSEELFDTREDAVNHLISWINDDISESEQPGLFHWPYE